MIGSSASERNSGVTWHSEVDPVTPGVTWHSEVDPVTPGVTCHPGIAYVTSRVTCLATAGQCRGCDAWVTSSFPGCTLARNFGVTGCILARNFRVTGRKENHVYLAVTSQVTVSGFGIQVSRELWSYVT